MISIATWNVLHRVHADNWDSEMAARWPEEAQRIAVVTAAVAARKEAVIGLQEVSGDQLASLREALPDRTFHVLDYPRIPTPRRVPNTLADRTEHLVLIVRGPSRLVLAEPHALDPGKGLVAVEIDGILIIVTHVTGDERRSGQFARLAEVAGDGPAVLIGDFNVGRDDLAAGLGEGFTVTGFPPDSVPTRPRTSGAKSQFIDHVVAHGVPVRGLTVEDVAGVSDHNLVRAEVG
ncbi:endonuclease/exonuclease/phosphatase family protein [Nocardia aurantiaca]|uniref:Endonuclease/exonuclease/phosphatase family protein n=1 Tax=Nocardia aurantiaca TaxID=2675850 RepID=A0A6I3L1Y3_9NOCA|nr:endonuclease/exonuclease/phosphatase family protein [Nocardia aurantiaca]MTE14614.1 endonuclease/exonuclease/phosphatase family protein [Nocardia aurantiaca]